ncbi:FAD-dependent thymidylate synthase [Pseudobacillus badius]|uniref:FAD-dependent thymidylate synthase n=1 Tax=Bacillus badius TaxID=1455 RepID=UPI0007B3F29E|nr:FAD-dependent thymidylate synthase [Bacillus badius]KZR57536.1 hypothetical protein A3781_19790 [Bacillus badius]
MKIGLIHYTPAYHKLVEMTARECYQSYSKLSESSENFIKGILAKGHISIASTGNIVFGISGFSGLQEYAGVMTDLMVMKEINNYIRWTMADSKKNPDTKIGIIVSMNLLTFLDINKEIGSYEVSTTLWEGFKRVVSRVPELNWFLDDKTKLEPKENPYTAKGEPTLGNPVILSEDYTALKEKGLTDYELDIHATITMNLKVDRATGLQIWRHADMTGGTELSQRYVDRSAAEYRKMVDFEVGNYPDFSKYMEKYNVSEKKAKEVYDYLVERLNKNIDDQIEFYTDMRDDLIMLGVRQGRAKEIARAALPNALTTKIINCRPLRQWKHFLKLRDTNHAQKEVRSDAQSIKTAFDRLGIPYE